MLSVHIRRIGLTFHVWIALSDCTVSFLDECIGCVIKIIKLVPADIRGISLTKVAVWRYVGTLYTTIITLSHQLPRLRHPMPLRIVTFLFTFHYLLGPPVSLITAVQSAQIVKAATLERIAEFVEGLFEVFIGCFVAAE